MCSSRSSRAALLVTALVLPLALAGCGDDDGASGGSGDRDRSDSDGAGGWDATGGTDADSVPCGLISAESRDALTAALDTNGSGTAEGLGGDSVGLFPGEETFVACGFAGGMLHVGVRAFDDGRPVTTIATPYGSDPAEPVAGLGDEAYVAVNSYDGLRVTVRSGDRVVLVDSQFRDDTDAVLPEELLADLAREVADGAAAVDVPAVEIPAACPDPADELVTARVGEVRAARGAVGAAGIRCAYVGDGASTTIATPYGSDPAEPVAGLGDEAYVAVNSYDGLRVTVRSGDRVVLVDSQFRDDTDAVLPEELLADLAREVADGAAAVDVPAVEIPAACPDPADELVTARVGEVRAARGAVGAAGIRCAYVGDGASTTIASQVTNEGYLAMGLAGAGDPVEVDGDEVYVDGDSAVLVASGECAVTATRSPLGWALADTRGEDEQRDDLVELAAAAYDVLGCA